MSSIAGLLPVALDARARRTCPNLAADARLPAASAPPAWRAGIKPSGELDLGLLVCDAEPASARPLLRLRRAAAPVLSRSAAAVRCAPCSPTPATPTRRPAGAGRQRRQDAGRGGAGRARRGRGRPRLDRRDRPAAAGRAIAAGILRPPQLSSDGDVDFSRRSRRPTRCEKRATWRSSCPPARSPHRAVQGRRDDLAALRHDALLRRRPTRRWRRRRPTCCSAWRQALVRPRLGRRPALDQRHGDPMAAAPAVCDVASRERGRAALWRGARRAAAPARDPDRADGEGAERIGA